MRVAHVVDVRPLHEEDLLLHLLTGDGMSSLGIGLVAVGSLEFDGAVIDVEVTSLAPKLIVLGLRVPYLYLTKSGVEGGSVEELLPTLVVELGDEDHSRGCGTARVAFVEPPRGRRTSVSASGTLATLSE